MTDSDDLLATPDDVKLVANEIDRCLTEAGDRLHLPPGGRGSAHSTSAHVQAEHYLMRVQLLDRLGVRRAAAYLRTELLNAIADQRRNDDSVVLQEMGFTPYRQPFPGSIVTGGTDPSPITALTDRAASWEHLHSIYEAQHYTYRTWVYGA